MGSTSYSYDDYAARATYRSTTGTPTFAYDSAIRSGKVAAKTHPTLSPLGAYRESRDSAAHPVTVPIMIVLDTTGSMGEVPGIIQKKLNTLMGTFLEEKTSGAQYLGDGYPAILISAVDDYYAMAGKKADGALQVGQFESGIEIEDNLTNLWLTGQGGGNSGESYDLALYFAARHTVHDHMEKRGRRGHLFIIGDEPIFDTVSAKAVRDVIGDSLQGDIDTKTIVSEVKEKYHVYYVLPNMTTHYASTEVRHIWKDMLGNENVLLLDNPEEICTLIAAVVAMNEGRVTTKEMREDGIPASVCNAVAVVAGNGAVAAQLPHGGGPVARL